MDTRAQTNTISIQPVDSTQNTLDGRVVVPVKPTEPDPNILGVDVARPIRPEQQALPQETLDRLRKFDRIRREYLEKEEAIRKAMLGATDEDRARARERLKELRERWLEISRERRQAIEERRLELKDKLEAHRPVLDSTREDARQAVREKALETREQIREQLNQEGRER